MTYRPQRALDPLQLSDFISYHSNVPRLFPPEARAIPTLWPRTFDFQIFRAAFFLLFRSQRKCCLLSKAFPESMSLVLKWPSPTQLSFFLCWSCHYTKLSLLFVYLFIACPSSLGAGTSSISLTEVSSALSQRCIPNK